MLSEPSVFVDLETTGADPRNDRVTEVAVVETVAGQIVSEWSTLVNPGRVIPAGIEALTGITNEMVSSAPTFADIALDIDFAAMGLNNLFAVRKSQTGAAFFTCCEKGIEYLSKVLRLDADSFIGDSY